MSWLFSSCGVSQEFVSDPTPTPTPTRLRLQPETLTPTRLLRLDSYQGYPGPWSGFHYLVLVTTQFWVYPSFGLTPFRVYPSFGFVIEKMNTIIYFTIQESTHLLNVASSEGDTDNVRLREKLENGLRRTDQNLRALEQRNYDYRKGKVTKSDIDCQKHHDQHSPPIVLALVISTHHLSSDLEEVTALCMWQNRMDKEETYWITHYGTYLYGLNQAREGQLGYSSITIFQTQLSSREMPISGRRSSRRFDPVIIAKDSGPWAIPQKHEVMGVRVGKILHHIRTGNRAILQNTPS
jgi:hypothetical protein